MNKALITAVIGLSMLYTQSVSADVSAQSAAPKSHKAHSQHHGKSHHVGKHHHKHHAKHHHHYKHEGAHGRHHPQRGYRCPEGNCEGMIDERAYMRNQVIMDSSPGLDQIENDMSIINRDHDPARGGRGSRGG